MNNHIKRAEECERGRVATFLVEQFKKEFSRFSIEKELLVELFSRAIRTQQCFILTDSHEVIGLITYSTRDQASFEISMKEIKEILGWKSLQVYFDVVQKEKKVGNHQIYINTLAVHPKYRR